MGLMLRSRYDSMITMQQSRWHHSACLLTPPKAQVSYQREFVHGRVAAEGGGSLKEGSTGCCQAGGASSGAAQSIATDCPRRCQQCFHARLLLVAGQLASDCAVHQWQPMHMAEPLDLRACPGSQLAYVTQSTVSFCCASVCSTTCCWLLLLLCLCG
jgi:hypothetical protein